MTRVETLREQAAVLRALARSFNEGTIRGDLLGLADQCEELGRVIEQNRARPVEDPEFELLRPGTEAPAK